MKPFSFILFTSFLLMSFGEIQERNTITTIELKELLSKNKIQLIDVRTPKEIKGGFIETAIFIDFYEDDFIIKTIKVLDKNKPVYVYCKSGGRSGKTTKILKEKGFEVYNVLGGYNKWKRENKK